MNSSNCVWECLNCALPNFSSSLFDLHSLDTSNSFSTLDQTDDASSTITSPGLPLAASSPQRKPKPSIKSKIKPLRILNLNCQSLMNKKEEFHLLLESTKADIVFGTESWLRSDIKDHEVFPDGYSVYRKDRQTGRGGGVFIAVKDHFISSHETDLDTDCEILWVKLDIAGCKSLYLAAYYRPNANDQESLAQLAESLEKLRKKNSHIWVAGDMNLPGLDWPSCSLKTNCPSPSQHSLFLEILADHGLTQVTDKPTREENVLDLVAINNPSLLNRLEVIPGISDHDAVFAELDISPKTYNQAKRDIPIYRKANWEKIEEDMKNTQVRIESEAQNANVNSLWEIFKSQLQSAIKQHVPHRRSSNRDRPPWITQKVRRLIRSRNRLFKKIQQHSTDARRERLKTLKKSIQKASKEAYWTYTESLITEDNKNSSNKKLWTFIKHKKTDSIDIAPLKDNGILRDSPKEKAEILNSQFSSVFTTDSPEDFPDKTPLQSEHKYPNIPDIEVSEEGINKLLTDLNPNKAMGPDGLHPRILKQLAKVISPILRLIFQKSIDTGEIPSDWKKANVAPIFKKGVRYEAANYRPVSLTCICSKLLEHIVTKHLLSHLESNKILYDLQHGFRHKRSTETQLMAFTQDVLKNLGQGKQTDVIIMDFAKAFDKVSHWRLAIKLKNYGVTGAVNNWIQSFLSNRTQRVVCNGEASDWTPVHSGVPQGSVIGPILFLIYINDLPDDVKSTVRLFADDTIMYMTMSSENDAASLQQDLDKLAAWEDKWKMKFHPKKCSVLRITRKKSPNIHKYQLHGHVLEPETNSKYLGLIINEKLSWNHHIDSVCKKGNSSLAFLRRNLQISQQHIKSNAYTTLVRPQLEYGAAIWDPYTKLKQNQLEMVQRRAARYVCNDYSRHSSVTHMLQQLGWRSLLQRRADIRLTFLYKSLNGLIAADLLQFLTPQHRASRHNHPMSFVPLSETKQYIQQSFLPRTVIQWNNLPQTIVMSTSLDTFKQGVCAITH